MFEPLAGKLRFGKLQVMGLADPIAGDPNLFLCLCDCSDDAYIIAHTNKLLLGVTQDCGCSALLRRKHKNPVYAAWFNMRKIARNKWLDVEPDWEDYATFALELREKPGPDYQFTRKDTTLGFTRENCCWMSLRSKSAHRAARRALERKTTLATKRSSES